MLLPISRCQATTLGPEYVPSDRLGTNMCAALERSRRSRPLDREPLGVEESTESYRLRNRLVPQSSLRVGPILQLRSRVTVIGRTCSMSALEKPGSPDSEVGHEIASEVAIQVLLRGRFIGRAVTSERGS